MVDALDRNFKSAFELLNSKIVVEIFRLCYKVFRVMERKDHLLCAEYTEILNFLFKSIGGLKREGMSAILKVENDYDDEGITSF